MESIVRSLVVALLVAHGLIHFLGVVKAFGWASVPQLRQPIKVGMGVVWLLAGAMVIASAAMLAARAPSWWWVMVLLAAMISQIVVVTSWSDAKAGTVVNVLMIFVAAYGFLTLGPTSFHAESSDRAPSVLIQVDPAPPMLAEADL